MMAYFPTFLDLSERRVVIVGHGPETETKVHQMLKAGACVTVVCRASIPFVAELAQAGEVIYRQRAFVESDLDEAWLVLAASEDDELNRRVARTAHGRKIFCNVVDVTPLCSFIFPAIVSYKDLHIAISTSGKSPALAQHLKKTIASQVGQEYGELNDLLGRVRQRVINEVPDRETRKELFHQLVQLPILDLLRSGQKTRAEQIVDTFVRDFAG